MNTSKLNLKELSKGASSALPVRILGIIFNYVFSFILANYYGASLVGIFSITNIIFIISSLISRMGLDLASVKLVSKFNVKKRYDLLKNSYFNQIIIISIMSLLVYLTVYFSTWFLIDKAIIIKEINLYIKILSFGIYPFSLLLLHSECLRGFKYIFKYSFYKNLSIPLITSILIIFVRFLGNDSLLVPFYSYVVAIIFLSFLSFRDWFKLVLRGSAINYNFSIKEIKDLLKLSIPMMFTNSLFFILQWVSIIILGLYCSSSDVGLYDISFKIAMLTSIFLFAVNSISAPKFSELYTENKIVDLKENIELSTKLIFWSSLPISIILIIFSDFFLSFFGQEFVEAKWTLIILVASQLVNSLCGSVGNILLMTGKEVLFSKIIGFSVCICIIMNLLLVPKYGILGAAYSNLICTLIWNLYSVYYIKKEYNILTVVRL